MPMKTVVIYIHGKGGDAREAEHYRLLFPNCDVVGLDYKAQTPWEAKEEFPALIDALRRGYGTVLLIANSIGAHFAMQSLTDRQIDRAYLISPIVDVERLILDMLAWAGVSEDALREKREIATPFGETLSWDYLCYERAHPAQWRVPTEILYGERDSMTSRDTIQAFADRIGAGLTVMDGGEHWFHTEEQMAFLDAWLIRLNQSAAHRNG